MIEILLATHNGEKYISEQIDSLLNQSFKDIRILINDDNSTDKTYEIVQGYKNRYPSQIEISNVKCGGVIGNFIFLMSKSETETVMFCDQDDVWKKDKIEKTYKKYQEIYEVDSPCLVYSDLEVVDNNLNRIACSFMKYQNLNGYRNKPAQLMLRNVASGCTIMCNRKCVQMLLEANDKENIAMHDWWLALIASQFGHIAFIDEPLMLYRQHEGNAVGAHMNRGLFFYLKKMCSIKENQKSLYKTRLQAESFGRSYDCGLFKEYGALMKKNKMKRIQFYIHNKVLFEDVVETMGLFILG